MDVSLLTLICFYLHTYIIYLPLLLAVRPSTLYRIELVFKEALWSGSCSCIHLIFLTSTSAPLEYHADILLVTSVVVVANGTLALVKVLSDVQADWPRQRM